MADKKANVVIIGAGTGGTIIANKLKKIKKKINLTVIDPEFKHIYQPGYLFVLYGKEEPKNLVKDGKKLLPKWANKVQDRVVFVDTKEQVVKTQNSGDYPYDYLVIASGSRLVPDKVEWWDDTIHHFYTPEAAVKLRDALQEFQGGKIVIGVADLPYKCPPAPLESAFLIDDLYRQKKMRDKVDIIFTSPINRAFTIETVSNVVTPMLEKQGIDLRVFFNIDEVDTKEKVIYTVEGDELEYDMLILIPPHEGQQFIKDSGLGEDGWINVNRETLQVEGYSNIYAVGDTTNLPISKAGSTAHYEAPIIVKNIKEQVNGKEPKHKYDGHVQCFFITRWGRSMFLDFNYFRPPKPGKPSRHWWWFKKIFKWFYFNFVAKGLV